MVTDEDKRVNATYIISVARKLGCSVFLLWDDIVEVSIAVCFWLPELQEMRTGYLSFIE
jgi:hypothetical protein